MIIRPYGGRMIIRPYGSEKFDKPGFETFYEAVNISGASSPVAMRITGPAMVTV